ncbi:hypothetical protein TrST_g4772 [Triparma strigata]|uniref:Uncharacterized protein n=1 Tax=Triparma strigata TaxID=1606541 RepID=A0A9W7AZR2_9STRA|nr:hypothetical protein TrST_g4772 [Triparma strigata]
MASQGGANGKIIVGAVVAFLGAAVGIGQVYLPYFSPQSEIRRDGNSLGKEAKEAEIARRKKFVADARKSGVKAPGSMWGNMNTKSKENDKI